MSKMFTAQTAIQKQIIHFLTTAALIAGGATTLVGCKGGGSGSGAASSSSTASPSSTSTSSALPSSESPTGEKTPEEQLPKADLADLIQGRFQVGPCIKVEEGAFNGAFMSLSLVLKSKSYQMSNMLYTDEKCTKLAIQLDTLVEGSFSVSELENQSSLVAFDYTPAGSEETVYSSLKLADNGLILASTNETDQTGKSPEKRALVKDSDAVSPFENTEGFLPEGDAAAIPRATFISNCVETIEDEKVISKMFSLKLNEEKKSWDIYESVFTDSSCNALKSEKLYHAFPYSSMKFNATESNGVFGYGKRDEVVEGITLTDDIKVSIDHGSLKLEGLSSITMEFTQADSTE